MPHGVMKGSQDVNIILCFYYWLLWGIILVSSDWHITTQCERARWKTSKIEAEIQPLNSHHIYSHCFFYSRFIFDFTHKDQLWASLKWICRTEPRIYMKIHIEYVRINFWSHSSRLLRSFQNDSFDRIMNERKLFTWSIGFFTWSTMACRKCSHSDSIKSHPSTFINMAVTPSGLEKALSL